MFFTYTDTWKTGGINFSLSTGERSSHLQNCNIVHIGIWVVAWMVDDLGNRESLLICIAGVKLPISTGNFLTIW